jgi:hypothetical protein
MMQKKFNGVMPHLIILGTALSWYGGIVYYKSDLSFTLLNIVSHGVPYVALIWLYGKKRIQHTVSAKLTWYQILYTPAGLLIFLAIPIAFAFIEEGLWDVWQWQEHKNVFALFSSLQFLATHEFKQIAIPLLITPQITHYVLDGFIWKVSKGHVPELV